MKPFKKLPWQVELFDYFKSSIFGSTSNIVAAILARRQVCHKSASCLMLLLYSITHSDYSKFGYFAPSYKQCRKQFQELRKWSLCYNLHCSLTFNESRLEVTDDSTHSVLSFQSLGSNDNLRGDTLDGAVVDEAAFISDDAIALVFPMLDVSQGWLILASTPWKKSGSFYNLFVDSSVHTFDWTKYDLSSLTTPERIEFYRRTLKPSLFKTEILGEFLDDGESILYGNISSCVLSSPPSYNNESIVLGVDTSSGSNDFCAITAFFLRDGVAYEHSTLRFCNSDVTSRINQFSTFISKFTPISIKAIMWETNGGGSDLMQLVKKNLPSAYSSKFVQDFWSASTKGASIANSVLWFNTDSIRLHSSILIQECCNYSEFVDKNGKVSYGNLKQGDRDYHDDCWCAALHALTGLRTKINKGSYTII